jgi:hypothetical protein
MSDPGSEQADQVWMLSRSDCHIASLPQVGACAEEFSRPWSSGLVGTYDDARPLGEELIRARRRVVGCQVDDDKFLTVTSSADLYVPLTPSAHPPLRPNLSMPERKDGHRRHHLGQLVRRQSLEIEFIVHRGTISF